MSQTPQFTRNRVDVLQVNVGKICNMSCSHCHVEAGPHRSESMSFKVAEQVIRLMDELPISTVDITGGAPELNPNFRTLVQAARARNLKVIDRCNLSILLVESQSDLIEFLVANQVHIIASLPCYLRENVDQQRGSGAFNKSIRAIKKLNLSGYGLDPNLILDFVYNPAGLHLAPDQGNLEIQYRKYLQENFDIKFNHLIALHNFPVGRFADSLRKSGEFSNYLKLLSDNYNPQNLEHLMCRSQLSIGYNGSLHDCDFHQMENIEISNQKGDSLSIFDLHTSQQLMTSIPWKPHCFACTAGNGASCKGSLTN